MRVAANAVRGRTPSFARRASSALAAAVLGVTVTVTALPMPAFARGPESLADLAEKVTDAVVNISASTTVEASNRGGRNLPQLPQGTPFEDLFEEFFKRRGQGAPKGDEDSPRGPTRKSNSLGSGFIIDASGIVVTNNHVIGDANDIQVIDLETRGRADRPPRPWLGLYATETEDGVVVMGIADKGPAEAAGLRAGDVLAEVAGEPVTDLAGFFRQVWALGPAGVRVPLTVNRDGRLTRLALTSVDRDRFLIGPKLH